MTEYDRLKV